MSFWIKGSSDDYIDFSNDLAAILENNSVSAASINAGGSGYVVGDILTVAGGTALVAAQIEVTSVSGGVIDGIRIFNAGSYSADPTTTANAVTGGSGSSATIDLTMSDLGWTVDRDTTWSGSEREVIAHGEGGGADEIYVGWRSFSNVGDDYYNWELHGLTGYSSGLGMTEQPGVSPGDHEAGNPQDYGTYLILSQNSFNWWLNINSYRIIITVTIGPGYWHAYMGLGNRFGTALEYPYPMLVSAPSERHDVNSNVGDKLSSITDPWIATSLTTDIGGTVVYMPGGGWELCVNRTGSSPSDEFCVVPTQRPQIAFTSPSAPEDRYMSTNRRFADIIFSTDSGTGGTTVANLQPSGDNDDHLLLPCIYVRSVPTAAVLLEPDECRWCNNFGGVASEDRFVEADGSVWRVFRNGNRTDTYAYLAIKEAG